MDEKLKSMEEIEIDILTALVEQACDYDLESNPLEEELYNKYIKDPRSEKARKEFRRPVYGAAGE